MYFADKDGNIVEPAHYFGKNDFPKEMLDVVTFESVDAKKTRLTICRNHALKLAEKYGEIQGWNESLDKFAKAILS